MKSISVELEQHQIVVKNGSEPWIIRAFSTGMQGHLTPLIKDGMLSGPREVMHFSSKYKDKFGHKAAMPFSLFFDNTSGCAFHAGNPNLPSHGCIHLVIDDARRLFEWAGHDKVTLSIQHI